MVKQTTGQANLNSLKFHIPSISKNQVIRDHLIQRLQTGLNSGNGLTLISAPAGYGKSALVVAWSQQCQQPFTWLTLDEADDEPVRFFRYFITALQILDFSIGAELAVVLRAGQLPSVDALLDLLVQDILNTQQQIICVLDDFHHIQDKIILDVLHAILTHEPHNFHLVLITREDPALPLARLRSRNQITELRASDLRFIKNEITHLFRHKLNINLSDGDISLLEQRTEGWIAGLQLAGLSMQGKEDLSDYIASLSGNHRYILSYLTEEVLSHQSTVVQEFLIQCSVLSRLSGDLCDAVTLQSNSAALLEDLFAANLFIIPMDDEGRWYRFHPLFADLLRVHLRQRQAAEIEQLHLRASQWYMAHNSPLEAIEHALAAADYARVVQLLEEQITPLLNQGYVRQIESWTKSLPDVWRDHSPRTNLSFGWIHLLRANFPQVGPYLMQAKTALASMPENKETQALTAECFALESNLLQSQGKLLESITAAQNALQRVETENSRIKGLAYLGLGAGLRQTGNFPQALDALEAAVQSSQKADDLVTGMLATTHLVLMCLQHGKLKLAEKSALYAINWMEFSQTAPPPIVGAVYGSLGLVYYEWNQMDIARDYYMRGIHFGTFSGHNASIIYTKLNLNRLYQAMGDFANAKITLQEAVALLQKGAPGWLLPDLVNRQVSFALANQDVTEADTLLRHSSVQPADPINGLNVGIHLAYVRLFYNLGDGLSLKQGLDLANRIYLYAVEKQVNNTTIQVLILGSLIHAALGDRVSSVQWLQEALNLADSEGYVRLFIDEGEPLAVLLREMPKTPFSDKLITCFTADLPHDRNVPSDADLIHPLTEREVEVLKGLAQGLTYAEIASMLIVSVNTVRYHVKGIYGKLSVDRQAKAIEKARELRLL